jgi:hypothetical protein
MTEEENKAEMEEEIEVIDVSLNENEIDEVIAHLIELKEHKKNVQFPLASDLDLSVTFSDELNNSEEAESKKVTENLNENVHEFDKQMQEVKNG